jgi:hypothetical protein
MANENEDPKSMESEAEGTESGGAGITRREFVAAGAAAAASALVPRTALAAGGPNPIYRIHPAIGIARVGNADPNTFFIGPEAPGYGPLGDAPGTQASPYKDAGRVKPQAARFRVFEYGYVNGRLLPVREVTLDTPGVSAIQWTVHLANKKASFYQFAGRQGEVSPPAPLRNAGVVNRTSLEIDPGARSIVGRSQGPTAFTPGTSANPGAETWPVDGNGAYVIDYLGQLRTDASGRLLVLGGRGHSASNAAADLTTYANNDNWFDDTSDGPVSATITVDNGAGPVQVPVDPHGGAWVLCQPPDMAPGIRGPVTGYDLLFDLAVRSIPVPPDNGLYDVGGPLASVAALKADFQPGADFEFPNSVPDFTNDIQPVLLAGYNMWYVDALVTYKHNSLIDPTLANPDPQYTKNRNGVFIYMRPPLGVNQPNGNRTMPHMKGDDPYIGNLPDAIHHLTLTHVQYGLLRNWANNQFTPPNGQPPPPPSITAYGLDRAALENVSGGAFFPGIEFSWQMRNPSIYAEPFRLDLAATSGYWGEQGIPIGPGYFTRQMAVPWQADFNDCRNEGDYGWWPHQRPNDALPSLQANDRVDWARPTVVFDSGKNKSTHADMVANWYKFGVLIDDGNGVFYETERAQQIP